MGMCIHIVVYMCSGILFFDVFFLLHCCGWCHKCLFACVGSFRFCVPGDLHQKDGYLNCNFELRQSAAVQIVIPSGGVPRITGNLACTTLLLQPLGLCKITHRSDGGN